MARALAEEVHLDERYVTERLRDAVAGMCLCMGLACVARWFLGLLIHLVDVSRHYEWTC